jgi:hypothetical protein
LSWAIGGVGQNQLNFFLQNPLCSGKRWNGPSSEISMTNFTDQQLQAYLDELLPAEFMSAIEQELRASDSLRVRLVSLVGMREAGVHGLGEIWRRNRLTCPSRQQLGSFLLGAISEELETYIKFHLDKIGCRVCRANLDDLKSQQSDQKNETQIRRKRYFQSSAGYLGKSGHP